MKTKTALSKTITLENAREIFLNEAERFAVSYEEEEGQKLTKILQNESCRDVLAACVNEERVAAAFAWASVNNDIDLLQAFHDIGMNVDAKTQYETSALNNAIIHGRVDAVRWLLDHNANVEIQDHNGMTPLVWASGRGNIKTVEMLLEKNAIIDAQNVAGRTPLIAAANGGHRDVVQLLLDHNANIGLIDKDGRTALDFVNKNDIKELLQNHVSSSYILK